jgi:hypothetical protein
MYSLGACQRADNEWRYTLVLALASSSLVCEDRRFRLPLNPADDRPSPPEMKKFWGTVKNNRERTMAEFGYWR